jgi:hypothetical protein
MSAAQYTLLRKASKMGHPLSGPWMKVTVVYRDTAVSYTTSASDVRMVHHINKEKML